MGITKLADLIRSHAPDAISYKDISDYTGNMAITVPISLPYLYSYDNLCHFERRPLVNNVGTLTSLLACLAS